MTDIWGDPVYRSAVKRVMKSFGYQTRGMALVRDSDNRIPIVVALQRENIRDVLDRLDQTGGKANIVVPTKKVTHVIPLSTVLSPSEADRKDMEDVDIAPTLSVGRFIQLMQKRRETSSSSAFCLVVKNRDYDLEYRSTDKVLEYSA